MQIENTPDGRKYSREAEFDLRSDSVFLEVLYKGQKSLYYYGSEGVKAQFYIRDGKDISLLLYKKYIKTNEDGTDFLVEGAGRVMIENKKYIGQLIFYLKDCPEIVDLANKTTYT